MKLNLQCHEERQSGYGRMGYELKRSLIKYGVEPCGRVDETGASVNHQPDGKGQIPGPTPTFPDEIAAATLWLSTPPAARRWVKGQHASIFTMWESTEMPAGFR